MNSSKAYVKLNKSLKIMLFMAIVVIWCAYACSIMAKFMQSDISREIIVATPFYFSSDYLEENDNDGNPPEYTMSGWDGRTDKSFAFIIRNYENPLLYNDSSQDVNYNLTYINNNEDLINVTLWKYAPDDATAINGYIPVTSGSKLTLVGGVSAYSHDTYKVTMSSKNGTEPVTQDVSIVVSAQTVDTQYIKKISTKITLQYSEYASFLSSSGFENPVTTDHSLTYVVCTANGQDSSEMVNSYSKTATKTLHVSWDNDCLELNKYDDRMTDNTKIVYVGADNDESNNIYTQEYIEDNIADFKNVMIINKLEGANIGNIYYDALPFSEFKFKFFKRYGNNSGKYDDIELLINTEIIE